MKMQSQGGAHIVRFYDAAFAIHPTPNHLHPHLPVPIALGIS